RRQEGGGKPAVQRDRPIAARLRAAHNSMGAGHCRFPQDGVRSLLRAEREAGENLKSPSYPPPHVGRVGQSTHAERRRPMEVQRFLYFIDGISTWVGKAAAWLIIGLTAVVCVEVFKRYIMNMPTAWIFDADNMIYGTLFMLSGAYTLAQNAHVRGDFLYSSMRPRLQAGPDLRLFVVFFLPRLPALLYARADYAGGSRRL